jgi:hypothetical protein
MEGGGVMPKDFDMIIRISSERAEVEVEQHSKKGVVTRKISPRNRCPAAF